MTSDLLTPKIGKRTSDINYRAKVKAEQITHKQRLLEAAKAILVNRCPKAAILRPEDVEQIIFESGGICAWCSKKLPPKGSHFDHIFPYGMGGQNTVDNIALCCPRCNRRKQNHSPLIWLQKIFAETHILTPLIGKIATEYHIELHHNLSLYVELAIVKPIEVISNPLDTKKQHNVA